MQKTTRNFIVKFRVSFGGVNWARTNDLLHVKQNLLSAKNNHFIIYRFLPKNICLTKSLLSHFLEQLKFIIYT